MPSQVDICNAALIKVGQDIPIVAITENTKAGRAFNRVWARIVDLVLSERTWPWATKIQALALSSEDAPPGWTYRYVLPADCLTVLAVCDAYGARPLFSYVCNPDPCLPVPAPMFPFDIMAGDTTTCIVTDLEAAYLIFVSRIADTGRYPAPFVECLSGRLAMEVAPPLAGELGLRMAGALQQGYEYSLMKAGAHAFNQGRDYEATTPAIVARGG